MFIASLPLSLLYFYRHMRVVSGKRYQKLFGEVYSALNHSAVHLKHDRNSNIFYHVTFICIQWTVNPKTKSFDEQSLNISS